MPTDAGIGSRLLAGSTTGALAVAVAQPTDVVKVRFQAQARAGGGRRYQSTVEAYKTIAREEGIRGLWKGVCWVLAFLPSSPPCPGLTQVLFSTGTSPNVARNAIVNCAELVTYDLIKDTLLKANLMTGALGPLQAASCLKTTSCYPACLMFLEFIFLIVQIQQGKNPTLHINRLDQ